MEYSGRRGAELRIAEPGTAAAGRVQPIAEQVLAALDEAHGLGVIHRDLKPSNIFLCRAEDGSDFVKVFDFGIAKVTGDGQLMATAKLTVSGGVMGTPVYMSPEQCRGEELTPAADFYSLGIVLYELLTGRVPFDDENPVRILLMHNHDPVPPLESDLAIAPLGRAVLRSLQKLPADRFATAAEFLAALRGEFPPSPAPKLQPVAAAVHQEPEAPQPSRAWLWWLIAAGLLLVGGVIAAIVWFR